VPAFALQRTRQEKQERSMVSDRKGRCMWMKSMGVAPPQIAMPFRRREMLVCVSTSGKDRLKERNRCAGDDWATSGRSWCGDGQTHARPCRARGDWPWGGGAGFGHREPVSLGSTCLVVVEQLLYRFTTLSIKVTIQSVRNRICPCLKQFKMFFEVP
jgi:hypothetical protein